MVSGRPGTVPLEGEFAGQSPQERMVAAAAELLIHAGPDAITHRRVAEAAGVPRGSANYFFPTRAELFSTAVRSAELVRLAGATRVAEAIVPRWRTPAEAAALLIEAWYAPGAGPDVVRARLDPMIDALHEPELAAVMAESRPRLLAVLRVVLERCGFRADADVDLIALVLDGSLVYEHRIDPAEALEAARGIVTRLLALLPRGAGGAPSERACAAGE